MLPLRHGNVWLLAGAMLVGFVIYASLTTGPQVAVMPPLDKLNHFVAYAALAFWGTGLVRRAHYGKVAVALAALGLALEGLQYAMAQGRMAEPLDMAANLAGIAAGLLAGLPFAGGWTAGVEAWLARD